MAHTTLENRFFFFLLLDWTHHWCINSTRQRAQVYSVLWAGVEWWGFLADWNYLGRQEWIKDHYPDTAKKTSERFWHAQSFQNVWCSAVLKRLVWLIKEIYLSSPWTEVEMRFARSKNKWALRETPQVNESHPQQEGCALQELPFLWEFPGERTAGGF